MVSEPVWQEWISFRCTWTARFARLVAAYIQELNPEVAILVNSGIHTKENMALVIGNDLLRESHRDLSNFLHLARRREKLNLRGMGEEGQSGQHENNG